MKKTYIFITLITLFAMAQLPGFAQSGTITNIQVAQRTDGSGLVDVNFDLSGSEDSYFMNMRVSFDSGITYYPITFNSMSGDVGPEDPGSKHIIWNPSIDYENRYSPETKLKITAYVVGTANPCPGTPTVEDYDGNVYHTVLIGEQCWMASNLNTTRNPAGATITRYCYNNDADNCEYYGGLYNWATVMNGEASSNGNPSGVQGLCPDGWHLPSHAEWSELTNYLIDNYTDIISTNVGNKLKSCRQVDSPLGGDCSTIEQPRWEAHDTHYGTNDFGFTALPGGHSNTNSYLGSRGYWWSSLQNNEYSAYYRSMSYSNGSVTSSDLNKSFGMSVRCVKD